LSKADSVSKDSNQLSAAMIGLIIALAILCVLILISGAVYYYCMGRNKVDNIGQLQLREWIRSNPDNVNITLFDSPQYRQSVLKPRASENPSPIASPRFSLFNQNPFAISFRSINPRTEGEHNMTMDEQYRDSVQGQGSVPDTKNPAQSNRRQNSVRIHLPITRDTEVFGFNL